VVEVKKIKEIYMNKETQTLLQMLPEEQKYKVELLERETGLIDNCKYMLYFIEGYGIAGEEGSVPVNSLKEAVSFVKDAYLIK
jgi:hypothetical protein